MSEIDWPAEHERTPADERRPYPHGFGVSRSRAFESILDKLAEMDARNVQLDTGAEHQKRNPNKPYAGASFDDPGVVARYELDGTQYAVAMDRWDNPRDNARAIALTLDAKRALTRYGVESVESEFRRHELPPPGETGDAVVAGAESAHDVLGVASDAAAETVEAAYRARVHEAHPDKPGGSDAEFKRVREAREAMLDE